jgi:hypothetical protein
MNVYYLPERRQTDSPEVLLTASQWSVLRARAHRAWWRLRLTVSEVRRVIRRGGVRNPLEDHVWLGADEPAVPRRRARGPARVIDLDAARRRRSATLATASL